MPLVIPNKPCSECRNHWIESGPKPQFRWCLDPRDLLKEKPAKRHLMSAHGCDSYTPITTGIDYTDMCGILAGENFLKRHATGTFRSDVEEELRMRNEVDQRISEIERATTDMVTGRPEFMEALRKHPLVIDPKTGRVVGFGLDAGGKMMVMPLSEADVREMNERSFSSIREGWCWARAKALSEFQIEDVAQKWKEETRFGYGAS